MLHLLHAEFAIVNGLSTPLPFGRVRGRSEWVVEGGGWRVGVEGMMSGVRFQCLEDGGHCTIVQCGQYHEHIIYIYISLFVMKTEKKQNKNKHEQLSITNRIQCTIMHKQKQNYVRHFDLNTSRIRYFSELT